MSSRGVTNQDMASVAMCSVLYRPMKLLMCLTLEISSYLVFRRELLLCGDTSRNPPSLQIQPVISTVLENIIVLLGSILRLARKSFSRMIMKFSSNYYVVLNLDCFSFFNFLIKYLGH